MNVLLIGHACGPGLGSEPGATWNWAQQLGQQHRVWVIAHPQFRERVNAAMAENPNPNITFIFVDVDSVWDFWNPAKGERGIRLHYLMWLKRAYAAATDVCGRQPIDVAHHVSWGTLRAAPPLWKLPVPTVWGPLGGGQSAPFRFLSYFGWRFWQEMLRSVSSAALYFSTSLRKAARSAALVFATNSETEALLTRISGTRVRYLLDCGIPSDWVPQECRGERRSPVFMLLWAGRLEHRKALKLALQALVHVRSVSVRLTIAGSGPLRNELEKLAKRLGVFDRVEFLGSVPYEDMQTLFHRSDAFLFTSLRDSFGSVVLEAMAQGLPVISLNHQGVGTFVPEQAGIKVPVTTPGETIRLLANAIETVEQSPSLRRGMQLAAWEFAKQQTWPCRARQMTQIYEEVVARQAPQAAPSTRLLSADPIVGAET